jgi:hypothetical protein
MAPNCSLFGPFCAQIDFSSGCQILKQNPGFFDGRCITKDKIDNYIQALHFRETEKSIEF